MAFSNFRKNKINYKNFMNMLCDLKAIGVTAKVNVMFLKLFFMNLRFLSLKNKNGLYFFRDDLILLPQSTVFLKRSGLSRAQFHFTQLSSMHTSKLVSVDHLSFRLLSGQPSLFYSTNKSINSNLKQKRGFNVVWNDGTILKHLLLWEALYAPGFLTLNGFSNWHVFFLHERNWLFKSSWAQNEVNYLLMMLLISKGFSKLFSHYMPPFVIQELYLFLNRAGVKKGGHKHFLPFYAWVLDNLRWSTVLGQSYVSKWDLKLKEDDKLKFDHYSVHDDDLMVFGGWMWLHKFELIDEMQTWVFPQVEEFKVEDLLYEAQELALDDLLPADWDEDEFIEFQDIFVWPWAEYWDEFFSMEFVKSQRFFVDLSDREDVDLCLGFYFSLKTLKEGNLLSTTPSSVQLLNYFEQTFKSSIWNQLSNWFSLFYPRTFNTFKLVGFDKMPLLLLLSSIISKLNGLFLYGFQGYDRRNIFFRLFYFIILKHRGFFFKWFSILLKRVTYNLPWEEELVYILHVLEQDQIFFQDVCKKKLYNYYYMVEFAEKCKSSMPFLFFFEFFFKNQLALFVRKKREELYPGFVSTLEQLMMKDSNAFVWYALKVTVHIYISIILDFLKNPMMFIRIIQFYELKFDKGRPVFQVSWKDYVKTHKGGSFSYFFKQLRNYEMLIKEMAVRKHFYENAIDTGFNDFLINKNRPLDSFLKKLKADQMVQSGLFMGSSLSLNVLYATYSNFAVVVFKLLPLMFSRGFLFLFTGVFTATATKLSEYFLNFLNVYNGCWPEYKQQLPTLFHIGLRTAYFDSDKHQKRVYFFQQWWRSLSAFRDVFSFSKTLIFFLQVCWFYFMHLLFHVTLVLYKIFWRRVYEFYAWRLRVKETARIRFDELDTDLDSELERKLKQHPWVVRARFRSFAKEPHHRPWLCNVLEKKIKETPSPFLSDFWVNLYMWCLSLLFYRKLRRRAIVFKKELTFMFEKRNTSFIINVLLNFRFWSFFFTFLYLFVLRSFLLCLIFLLFGFVSVFLRGCAGVYSNFWVVEAFLKSFFWIFVIFFYTVYYAFSRFFFFCVQFLCLVSCFLFLLVKWLFNLILFVVWKLSVLTVFKPLFRFVSLFYYFWRDLAFNIRFNFYWMVLHFLSMWSVIRFVVILGLGVCVFFIVTLWFGLKRFIVNRAVWNDYSKTLGFLFKHETSVFYHDFQDFLFFVSFIFKFLCLIIGFFMFLFIQVGWKLVKFIFDEDYDVESLKIRTELPTYRVYQFLDIYVVLFFNLLKDFSLRFPNLVFFCVYSLLLDFFFIFFRSFGVLIFLCVFLKNFIWFFLQAFKFTRYPLQVFYGFFEWIFVILKYGFSFVWYIFSGFFVRRERNGISNTKGLLQLKTFSTGQVLVVRILLVVFTRRFFIFVLVGLKKLFKKSSKWVEFFSKSIQKLDRHGMAFQRDLQELMVFISVVYDFSAFYWAYIQKLSIEVGDLGWWLSYYKKKKEAFQHTLKNTVNFSLISKQTLEQRKKSSYNQNKLSRFFSKKHPYYLTLNNSFFGIKRYRAYIVNSFYVEKMKVLFKDSPWFSRFRWSENFLKRIGSFLGFSFLFEILFLRFQQPISSFLFGDKNKSLPLHVLARLKYFKDFFMEFNWLVNFTYDSKMFGFDHFFVRLVSKVLPKWESLNTFYKQSRSRWFFKVFGNFAPRVLDILPKFRWNYFQFLLDVVKYLIMGVIWLILSFIFFVILFYIVNFFIFYFFFYVFWLFGFWVFRMVVRFSSFLFCSGFLSFIIYILFLLL